MKLKAFTVVSKSGDYSRNVWTLSDDSNRPQKLCIFLDAELYIDRINAPEIIRRLRQDEAISPVTCIFVSHLNSEQRHYDYVCNSDYATFIAEDVFDWVVENIGDVNEEGNVICGLSLSGLASTHIALNYPNRFSFALSQSPSYWWNNEWLKDQLSILNHASGKYWISVGDQETESDVSHPPTNMAQATSQVDAAARFVNALKAQTNDVHFNLFDGGHDIEAWKAELSSALRWLI